MQVQYRGDKIVGDLTTAHPQPMPNGDLVNLVSTVRVCVLERVCVLGQAARADQWCGPGRAGPFTLECGGTIFDALAPHACPTHQLA